ncbi:cysteine hydrolase family protein [Butyrivibrio sp. VCB2006]|uniref:cysteine hydrolase family protein n=1 Tax=Butyrivibrio sp. VCB2006 TaxID=1280679 RepID=UPI00040B7BED|nr:isochorismatase family protein [Butyrivibrio sp. VCB2006]
MAKALLVIDVQSKYMDKYGLSLIDRINERIGKSSDDGSIVAYVKNIGRAENAGDYLLDERLNVVSDYIFEKSFPSAFSSEKFCVFLKDNGITDLELIGVDGSSCVAKTAFDAVLNGYGTYVNLSCVSSINDKIFDKTIEKMENSGIRMIRE